MRAVILAGGKGSRLLPYTTILPKPLMPVGEQAIIELLIRQLNHSGFTKITVALGHLAHLVQAVLGNGNGLGSEINYSIEHTPLGTMGPLRLIKDLDDTFAVLNGDVLTDIDFQDLLRFHRESHAEATIATHRRSVRIDYGVIIRNGASVVGYDEKPVLDYEVSMGIYILEPSILAHIGDSYLDFPDLIKDLLNHGKKVASYPHDGIWFDLGRSQDFQKIQEIIETLSVKIPFFTGDAFKPQ